MPYRDLRDFLSQLRTRQELKDIHLPISCHLEMTEISHRVLQKKGPALLFNQVKESRYPVLSNLFGTQSRICHAMGLKDTLELQQMGKRLSQLKEPSPPRNLKDLKDSFKILRTLWNMRPKSCRGPAACHHSILQGSEVDLSELPIQHCWPDDIAPLITWGLVVTQGPHQQRQNLGVYRQQLLSKNKLIMRWLAHRGGALDFQAFQKTYPNQPFPVSVIIGADPATILSAVTPIPDHISEYQFSGLLRGRRTDLTRGITNRLEVPELSEIVLEGHIYPHETAIEGPFGDHTGYYNEQERFPVLTVECITMRQDPIYHSTYTGKPLDEPAILGNALNALFVPFLQKQYPEVQDFYLPPEGCSYRLAIVSIRKAYPGHSKRVMFGIWSFLRQFMYTKFIIVTDDDIDIRSWSDVIWAITTRVDPQRDTLFAENTPIDYLDFASPVSGLGSKMGIDATNKWPGESNREWGRPIKMSSEVEQHIDTLWEELGL